MECAGPPRVLMSPGQNIRLVAGLMPRLLLMVLGRISTLTQLILKSDILLNPYQITTILHGILIRELLIKCAKRRLI